MHGIYTVLHNVPDIDKRRVQMDSVLKASAMGLDTIYLQFIWLPEEVRGYKPTLDDVQWALYVVRTCERKGMSVIFEDIADLPLQDKLKIKNAGGWTAITIADDANRFTSDQLREWYCAQDDLGLPRYISIGANLHNLATQCYGVAEMVGLQIYPFAAPTETSDFEEKALYYWPILEKVREVADSHNQKLYANLQIHRSYGYRHPSPEQVRVLGLMSAIAGVDGYLWYAMIDNQGSEPVYAPQELLDAVRDVTREIRHYVSGRPDKVSLEGSTLTGIWKNGLTVKLDLENSKVLMFNPLRILSPIPQ